MGLLVRIAVLLVAGAGLAFGQALSPAFAFGRDYTFERIQATRTVHDAADNGRLTLVSYVYRPVKNDRHEVVLYSHGSTGGEIISPKEPAVPPREMVAYFVMRGYTVVAPMRRGRAESSGTYVEECSFYGGQCDLEQQTATFDRTIASALADTTAIVDQVIEGRLVPKGSKILIAGHSRGGFLSLLYAAEHPGLAKAVINFSGGWLSVLDRYPPAVANERLQKQLERLGEAGRKLRAPTIWIYGIGDPMYSDTTPAKFLEAFQKQGGTAQMLRVQTSLPNPHLTPTEPKDWEKQMDAFLSGPNDSPAQAQP